MGMIYASAQKNLGTAGLTVAIVRDDLLARIPAGIHTMLDYRRHAETASALNTPPVFAIYVAMLVTRWLLFEIGGLEAMDHINRQKAELVYQAIDRNQGFYIPHADTASRSSMNVTWRIKEADLVNRFLGESESRGLHELKGHRAVGGLRASLYNGVSLDSTRQLCNFIDDFASRFNTLGG